MIGIRVKPRLPLSSPKNCSAPSCGHCYSAAKTAISLDLQHGLGQLVLDPEKLIACFDHYLALEGKPITRAVAEQRMLEKLTRSLTEDIAPLLSAGVRFNNDDAIKAFERVWMELIARIKGDTWKLTEQVIEELRQRNYPNLLRNS